MTRSARVRPSSTAPRPLSRPFFVTWHLASGQRALEPRERDVVARTLSRGDGNRYQLLAFVVMDDHVHVLARPGGWSLDRAAHSWTSSAAQQLRVISGRRLPLWKDSPRLEPVKTDEQLHGLEYYIVGNPWKRWPFLRNYPWVWERGETAGW